MKFLCKKSPKKQKKLIIWGGCGDTKSLGTYAINRLSDKGIDIAYMVGNSKKYAYWKSIKVIDKEFLRELSAKQYSILLCLNKPSEEIENNLHQLGWKRGENYDYLRDSDMVSSGEKIIAGKKLYDDTLLMPSLIRIELSSYCNCKCEFCIFHGETYAHEFKGICNHNMSWDTLKTIVEQINEIPSIRSLSNIGMGEMFCNPNWFEMLEYIKQNTKIKKFHFHTNGVLLKPENVDKLIRLGFEKIDISFSIDGRNAEENELLRRGSDSRILKDNMEYLLSQIDERFSVSVQNTVIATIEELDTYDDKGMIGYSSYWEEYFDNGLRWKHIHI